MANHSFVLDIKWNPKEFSESSDRVEIDVPICTLSVPYPNPIRTLSEPYPNPIYTIYRLQTKQSTINMKKFTND